MNPTKRLTAGLVLYQNAGQTDECHWFIVTYDLLRQVSEICERKLFNNGYTDAHTWRDIFHLLFPRTQDGTNYHPDILERGMTKPWGWYGERDIPLNKYEIRGIIPIKQVLR